MNANNLEANIILANLSCALENAKLASTEQTNLTNHFWQNQIQLIQNAIKSANNIANN